MELDEQLDGQSSSQTQKRKGKEKEKKRAGRGRRPREEVERPPQLDADGNPIPKALRYPKRQCALMLGFCGSGYSGMQMCVLLIRRYFSVTLTLSFFLSASPT